MLRRSAPLVFTFLLACSSSFQLVEVQDVDTLYFGTARAGGVVTDAEWKAFVAEMVTPAYPEFTEWSATGHWRGAEEMTHVVEIAHLSRRRNDEAILRIIREYKKRFQQESVLWIRGRGLVAPQ